MVRQGETSNQVLSVNEHRDVHFDAEKLPDASKRYVLFVDIMGMKTTMLRSFLKSTIFIGKLHCILRELQNGSASIKVFPVMDGAYVVSDDIGTMYSCIYKLFKRVSQIFVSTDKPENCFLIRGCLSFGPILDGDEISDEVSKELAQDKIYKGKLLFGFPMILAVCGEQKAPPFGVYLDTTVRVSENRTLSGIWYRWCKSLALKRGIVKGLASYFDWVRSRCFELMYEEERINFHEKIANQYWN